MVDPRHAPDVFDVVGHHADGGARARQRSAALVHDPLCLFGRGGGGSARTQCGHVGLGDSADLAVHETVDEGDHHHAAVPR